MPRKPGDEEEPKAPKKEPQPRKKVKPDPEKKSWPELEALFDNPMPTTPLQAPEPPAPKLPAKAKAPKPKPEPEPEEAEEVNSNLVITPNGIMEVGSQALAKAPAQEEPKELNLNTLTDIYHRGSFEVIQALFSQAAQEATRLAKVRDNLSLIEQQLYNPLKIATMSTDELMRAAELSQRALTNSTNYMFKLHAGMTTGMEVIGALQKTQDTTKTKIDNPDLDSVKRELGDLLLQKIKEKSANQPPA